MKSCASVGASLRYCHEIKVGKGSITFHIAYEVIVRSAQLVDFLHNADALLQVRKAGSVLLIADHRNHVVALFWHKGCPVPVSIFIEAFYCGFFDYLLSALQIVLLFIGKVFLAQHPVHEAEGPLLCLLVCIVDFGVDAVDLCLGGGHSGICCGFVEFCLLHCRVCFLLFCLCGCYRFVSVLLCFNCGGVFRFGASEVVFGGSCGFLCGVQRDLGVSCRLFLGGSSAICLCQIGFGGRNGAIRSRQRVFGLLLLFLRGA